MLAPGNRKVELRVVHRQVAIDIGQGRNVAVGGRRLVIQRAARLIHQEYCRQIGLQQMRQFLQREHQNLVQRRRRRGQAAHPAQRLGPLGALARLLHQHGVLDDRGRLVGNNHQQMQLVLRKNRAAIQMVGGLQIAQHVPARCQRHQNGIAQAGGLRQVAQTNGVPMGVFSRVLR